MAENHLSPQERDAVIRETFDAYATVGFMKWKAEELMGWGYEVGEEDRQHYLKEFEKAHLADFQKMAANAPDDRLLDTRAYWIEKANTMGLEAWLEVLSQGEGGKPFYEVVAQEGANNEKPQKYQRTEESMETLQLQAEEQAKSQDESEDMGLGK